MPIVGLEPSCVSVFRDEAPNLLHGDRTPAGSPPRPAPSPSSSPTSTGTGHRSSSGRALVHGHCHHKSVLDFDAELAVLRAMGLELDVPDSGCCGMAGSFGFERGEHYEVSVAAGERVLLPAVRARRAGTRTWSPTASAAASRSARATGRKAIHPAELLALALRTGTRGEPRPGSGPRGRRTHQKHSNSATQRRNR